MNGNIATPEFFNINRTVSANVADIGFKDAYGFVKNASDYDLYSSITELNDSDAIHDSDEESYDDSDDAQLNINVWANSPTMHNYYVDEWYTIFGFTTSDKRKPLVVSLERLHETAITGGLKECRFRTICWRLFLGVLTPEVDHWLMTLTRQRKCFRGITFGANRNPRYMNCLDHPLSLEPTSAWLHYFHSIEVKRMIAQDVDRTFPDVDYFRDPAVVDMMVNILFCYVEHSHLEYKQGMHEILAPVIYALHCDLVAFESACEYGAVPTHMKRNLSSVFGEKYLEADAYIIFSRIMDTIHIWYDNTKIAPHTLNNASDVAGSPGINPSPIAFNRRQSEPMSPGTTYVEEVHNEVLRSADPKLYFHLKRLDIAPSLFGLRWIRLLFGHEFCISKVLCLWDSIFSVGHDFIFVRYIYVSMLLYIGDKLLSCGFSDCLYSLMHYPRKANVNEIVMMALHLYQPSVYAAFVKPNRKRSLQRTMSDIRKPDTKSPLCDSDNPLGFQSLRRKSLLQYSRFSRARRSKTGSRFQSISGLTSPTDWAKVFHTPSPSLSRRFMQPNSGRSECSSAFSFSTSPAPRSPVTTPHEELPAVCHSAQSSDSVRQCLNTLVSSLTHLNKVLSIVDRPSTQAYLERDSNNPYNGQDNSSELSACSVEVEHLLLAKSGLEKGIGLVKQIGSSDPVAREYADKTEIPNLPNSGLPKIRNPPLFLTRRLSFDMIKAPLLRAYSPSPKLSNGFGMQKNDSSATSEKHYSPLGPHGSLINMSEIGQRNAC